MRELLCVAVVPGCTVPEISPTCDCNPLTPPSDKACNYGILGRTEDAQRHGSDGSPDRIMLLDSRFGSARQNWIFRMKNIAFHSEYKPAIISYRYYGSYLTYFRMFCEYFIFRLSTSTFANSTGERNVGSKFGQFYFHSFFPSSDGNLTLHNYFRGKLHYIKLCFNLLQFSTAMYVPLGI